MTVAPIPFYVLCGSLGAGKTTLLMRLLEHWKQAGRRTGVLINEAGEVSVDGPRAGTLAEQVLNLAGGCVCCDTKEDLSWGIAQLVRDYGSDLLVLECSGLADPAEVVRAIGQRSKQYGAESIQPVRRRDLHGSSAPRPSCAMVCCHSPNQRAVRGAFVGALRSSRASKTRSFATSMS